MSVSKVLPYSLLYSASVLLLICVLNPIEIHCNPVDLLKVSQNISDEQVQNASFPTFPKFESDFEKQIDGSEKNSTSDDLLERSDTIIWPIFGGYGGYGGYGRGYGGWGRGWGRGGYGGYGGYGGFRGWRGYGGWGGRWGGGGRWNYWG